MSVEAVVIYVFEGMKEVKLDSGDCIGEGDRIPCTVVFSFGDVRKFIIFPNKVMPTGVKR